MAPKTHDIGDFVTGHPEILIEIIQKAVSHELRHFDLSNNTIPASFALCYISGKYGARSLYMIV
jgi:hypothetical protein